eukprot:15049901-Heterocapsa_arctica.AAC.1
MIQWSFFWYDLNDVLNSASTEQTAQRILIVQREMKKWLRSTVVENLEVYRARSLDASGGDTTPDFDHHISTLRKNEAQ